MFGQSDLQNKLVNYGRKLFLKGHDTGQSGNLSAQMEDGTVVITTNGLKMGRLESDHFSVVSLSGDLISGDLPNWEFEHHLDIYNANPKHKAIFTITPRHISKLVTEENLNVENVLPALSPIVVMRTTTLPRIPLFRSSGSCFLAEKAKSHHAVLIANIGLVVMGEDLEDALCNVEELEETAALRMQAANDNFRYLSNEEIAEINAVFAH
ncbi:class II aldolase/adducin family protein [Grimontia marina]|uniref:L-fuculose phosphate aldolase n=1 Tax=Grimontia marina TaxID=646534 RepID=A0A128FLE8_9GAMM|nr:class II aldolase/adducin family protein [Grimontia marina]CZF87091.1 L-fuculose phosphate aldolase [Grimontia marina]